MKEKKVLLQLLVEFRNFRDINMWMVQEDYDEIRRYDHRAWKSSNCVKMYIVGSSVIPPFF